MPTEYLDSNGLGTLWQQIRAADNVVCNSDHTIHEYYKLPTFTASADTNYDILTTKSAVTIIQGGTGATTAANARTNLAVLGTAGGTMTGQINFNKSGSFWQGRDKALVRGVGTTNTSVYRPLISGQTDGGSWEIGPYMGKLRFVYIPDTVYASGENTGYFERTLDNTGLFTGFSTGITTSNTGGYTTDSYGNFKHQSTTSTNTWNIVSNDRTSVFSINFETGATSVKDNIIINSNGKAFITKATDYSGAAAPSSNIYRLMVLGRDSADVDRAYVRAVAFTTGTQGIQIETKRVVSSTNYYNTLSLLIDASGTKSVSVSDAAAWRTALGLGSNATSSTAYLPLAGGTMTGTVNLLGVNACNGSGYPGIGFKVGASDSTFGAMNFDAETNHRFYFTQKYSASATYYEAYVLPPTASGLTANAWYSILTSKETWVIAKNLAGGSSTSVNIGSEALVVCIRRPYYEVYAVDYWTSGVLKILPTNTAYSNAPTFTKSANSNSLTIANTNGLGQIGVIVIGCKVAF